MGLKDTLLCAAFAVAMPAGQLMFKWAATYDATLAGPLPLRVLRNLPLMGAFGWYGLTALVWFYILTRLPLSQAYPFSACSSVPAPTWPGCWARCKTAGGGASPCRLRRCD